MTDAPNKNAKMRHCWYCGKELGVIDRKYYDRTDTCSDRECERAASIAIEDERREAHERLDRDMGRE